MTLCGLTESWPPRELTLPERLLWARGLRKRQQKQLSSGEGLFRSQGAQFKGRESCGRVLAAQCPATRWLEEQLTESSPALLLLQTGRLQARPLLWARENYF